MAASKTHHLIEFYRILNSIQWEFFSFWITFIISSLDNPSKQNRTHTTKEIKALLPHFAFTRKAWCSLQRSTARTKKKKADDKSLIIVLYSRQPVLRYDKLTSRWRHAKGVASDRTGGGGPAGKKDALAQREGSPFTCPSRPTSCAGRDEATCRSIP